MDMAIDMGAHQGQKLGLVLSGGGARSAYQAGVLVGLEQIARDAGLDPRFKVIAGTSGGAINGAFLACHSEDWTVATRQLWRHWETLDLPRVVNTRATSLFSRAFRLFAQLSLGGSRVNEGVTELLDAQPLAEFLLESLDFKKFRSNLAKGNVHGLGLNLTHYATGSCVTFFQGASEITPWMRSQRIGKRTNLTVKHVLASAAIPLLFPPVKIHGSYYGDGAVRMTSPLSPAIHMGADKVLMIGVRYYRTPQQTVALNKEARMDSIQFADIAGVLMNSIFLDALDSDLERMERINLTLKSFAKIGGQGPPAGGLRSIPVLAIRPSVDLGVLAKDEFHHFSRVLKHFLKGLGASEGRGSDMLSYLAFERSYTCKLLELGYKDALAQKDEYLAWLK